MRFTPEDLKELEPFIEQHISAKITRLERKVDLLQSDNSAFRKLLHKGDDE
jgi:hypothetical protein